MHVIHRLHTLVIILCFIFCVTKDVLRFWFERGVDGMRIDAIRHMYEDESFADEPINPDFTPPPGEVGESG